MLKDRGYVNIQSCQTFEEITQNMSENRYVVCGGGHKHVQVFFHNEERVGVKQLRTWVENSVADVIIVISLDGPTAFTKKEAEQHYAHVQFFMFRDVCINITKHCLVPKHEKITDMSQLPLKTSNSKNELPLLYTTDKISQYYAFEPGDVVRITRTVGVQEPVYIYRLITNPPSL